MPQLISEIFFFFLLIVLNVGFVNLKLYDYVKEEMHYKRTP